MEQTTEEQINKIYEVLVGTLDKPGFIEETKSDLRKVDYRLNSLEGSRKFTIGTLATLLVAWLGKVFLGV